MSFWSTNASQASKKMAHEEITIDYFLDVNEQDIAICEYSSECAVREAAGLPLCLAHYSTDCMISKYYKRIEKRTQ